MFIMPLNVTVLFCHNLYTLCTHFTPSCIYFLLKALCDFVDNYDAVKVGENCVRVVSTPATWPDAVETCTDEGGIMLMSHKTAFLQGDNVSACTNLSGY